MSDASVKHLFGDKVITPNVVYVTGQATIKAAIEIMVDKKISSVLVSDEHDNVVGIVTERDIVRKLTLVDVPDKLDRPVSTIMTRPVSFVTVDNYQQDILSVYLDKGVRHFPLLKGKEPKKENVVGIVSATDFLRQYLLPAHAKSKEDAKDKFEIAVLGNGRESLDPLVNSFSQLGISWYLNKDFSSFFSQISKGKLPVLLFDADTFPTSYLKKELAVIFKYAGPTLVVTKNITLLAAFQAHLNKDKQVILLKPADIDYVQWLITQKWRQYSLVLSK